MIEPDMSNRHDTPTAYFPLLAFGLIASAAVHGATLARAAEPYTLSPSEMKLDCKQLTGTIKVRLVALRQKPIAPTSAVSRGLQTLATPIWGGTRYGNDEDAQRAADRVMIETYNKRLVEKNCPSFDIAAALADPGAASPSPTIPAKTKPDAKK